MRDLRVCLAQHHNPFFNLATEDFLYQTLGQDQEVLYLWRNQKTIVIGRFQNPWVECNLNAMHADQVLLARRQSGGGAVYHDLGNTNFTFISNRSNYDVKRNFSIVIEALSTLGIKAETEGRNDLVVAEKKISGSAFRLSASRAFHHGTLLIETDLNALQKYLTPDQTKLAAKGIRSVASRVANLRDFQPELTHEKLNRALIEQFSQQHDGKVIIEELTPATLEKEALLNDSYQYYSSWQWRFGQTPAFSHTISDRWAWGGLSLHFQVIEGVVQHTALNSDALDVAFLETLQQAFTGVPYSERELIAALKKTFSSASAEQQTMVKDLSKSIILSFES